MEGLRTSKELVIIVVTLLCYGCPIQAIVQAYGLDERTVADWQKRAGRHCQQVQQGIVEQGKVQTHHVQADEIRARGGRWSPGWLWPLMPAVGYGWQESSVFVEIEHWQTAYCDVFAHAVTAHEASWSVLTDGPRTPRALCVRFATK